MPELVVLFCGADGAQPGSCLWLQPFPQQRDGGGDAAKGPHLRVQGSGAVDGTG